MKKNLIFLIVLALLVLPAAWSLFRPGFFPTHDADWMVIRLTDFHRSFVSGQIPVRWLARLNYGYGYPVINFVYPQFLYLGEFFYFFTGSFVNSIKIVFIISFFFSAIFMYLWTREIWGDLGGMVSALFYVYTPYRFLDVYVRGSVGEALAFVFPPLIFWMTDKLSRKMDKTYLAIGGLAFAGLLTAHNTLAMFFTLVYGSYLFFYWLLFRQKKVLWRQLGIFFLGLGLACFFWLPALYEKKYVPLGKGVVSDFFAHFPSMHQLLIPSWGYGYSLPQTDQEEISFQVGLANFVVFLLTLAFLTCRLFSKPNLKKFQKNWRISCFLLVFLVSFLLMLKGSAGFWRFISVYNLLQFPWRLLSLTTFTTSFLAGGLLQLIKVRFKALLALALIVLAIGLNYRYARPDVFSYRDESFYTTNDSTTSVANEYLPIWVKEPPKERPENVVEISLGQGEIKDLTRNSKKISFSLEAEADSEVQINTIYYPGWQVKVNGQKTQLLSLREKGLIRFKAEPGKHQVLVEFKETPVRLLADVISLISFGLVVILLLKSKKAKK